MIYPNVALISLNSKSQKIDPYAFLFILSMWMRGYYYFWELRHGAMWNWLIGLCMCYKVCPNIPNVSSFVKVCPLFGMLNRHSTFAWRYVIPLLGGKSILLFFYLINTKTLGNGCFLDAPILSPLSSNQLLGGSMVPCLVSLDFLYLTLHDQPPFLS